MFLLSSDVILSQHSISSLSTFVTPSHGLVIVVFVVAVEVVGPTDDGAADHTIVASRRRSSNNVGSIIADIIIVLIVVLHPTLYATETQNWFLHYMFVLYIVVTKGNYR